MSSLPSPATSVNWQTDTYQAKAQATRSRRQAAGMYKRPNKAQRAAYAKLVSRDGRKNLTIEEMGLLATHPHLTASQRAEFAEMAQAAVESITDTDVELARITRYIEAHPEDANTPYGELLARDIQVYDRIIAQCDKLLAVTA